MTPEQRVGDRLRQAIPSASEEQLAVDRAWRALRGQANDVDANIFRHFDDASLPAPARRLRRPYLVAAAALVVAAVGTAILWRPAEHAWFSVVEGEVHRGDTIRSNGGVGAVLALSDGSRVEMRSQTELSFERADDGMRIRLHGGGIIVNAAKQRAGHLYVQTRDITVSVVGTVFVVNAEQQGSRVAVIEGEVRVQQGASETKLRPGEQVSSNAAVQPQPVVEEIAWSRNATRLRTLLQQAAVVAPRQSAASQLAPSAQAQVTDSRERFEVASIRPRPGGGGGGGRGGGGPDGVPACGGGMDLDPRFVRLRGYSLYRLITVAYDGDCMMWELMSNPEPLSGGPAWIRSEQWDIEARIPEGALPYAPKFVDIGGNQTSPQHTPGTRLKGMLQTLLAERFKLVLRRETQQVPVYVLTVAKEGSKLTPWTEGDPATTRDLIGQLARNGTLLSDRDLASLGLTAAEFSERWDRGKIELRNVGLMGAKASIADLVIQLQRATLRPVIDRTGLTGEYNYRVRADPSEDFPPGVPVPRRMGGAGPGTPLLNRLMTSLERDLGLRLEPSRAAGDVLVIDHVERPSEN